MTKNTSRTKKTTAHQVRLLLIAVVALAVVGLGIYVTQKPGVLQSWGIAWFNHNTVSETPDDKAEQSNPPEKHPEKEPVEDVPAELANELQGEGMDQESVATGDLNEVVRSSRAIDKWGLRPPAFIISHSAYASEETARQIKEKLMKDNGLNANYFWIPDYVEGGKELYKVYIGPLDSWEEANDFLALIKDDLNTNAYVEKIK